MNYVVFRVAIAVSCRSCQPAEIRNNPPCQGSRNKETKLKHGVKPSEVSGTAEGWAAGLDHLHLNFCYSEFGNDEH